MRYLLLWLTVVAVLTLGMAPVRAQEKKSAEHYTHEYFPLGEGYHWQYRATFKSGAGEEPPKDVFITVDKQEPFEHKFVQNKQDASEWIVRYRLKVTTPTKELTEHVGVLKDGVYRFTAAGKEITPPLRFLKLPVMAGETWSVQSTSGGVDLTGTFRCDDESVKVPAGTFQAKRVSTQDLQMGAEKMTQDTWYAANVGMVRQHVRLGAGKDDNRGDVTLELVEFKKGK